MMINSILLVTLLYIIQIHKSEFTKIKLWSTTKCKTSLQEVMFPVSSLCMHMNRGQWNKTYSMTAPLVKTQNFDLVANIQNIFKTYLMEQFC